jgi:peptidoglycan/LPS O-acetylase OafA/YrhL
MNPPEKSGDFIPFWRIPALSIAWFSGAWLASRWHRIRLSPAGQRRCLWIGLFGLLFAFALFSVGVSNQIIKRPLLLLSVIYFSLPFFILTIIGLRSTSLGHGRCARFCTFLGVLSYPLYLLHEAMFSFFKTAFVLAKLSSSLWIDTMLFLLVGLSGSIFIGYPIEILIMKWRKKRLS